MREIYLAGGCYWGVEKYLSNIKGVAETTVGFANGDTEHPTYEQVRYHNTGHAETVKVAYEEEQLPLAVLLKLFYKIDIETILSESRGCLLVFAYCRFARFRKNLQKARI